MKSKNMLIALALLTTGSVWAEDLPKDTLRVIDVEEVVIIASPKETRKLREQSIAVSLLSQKDMQANLVTSMKNLTGLVPNLFIPDYGSRLTSAIYIRGIGSRINTPSVGLYVDNMPYMDKSAFDFNYADIERIDVLRGPQGTLYGRNTMGGLIKVHTKSPFSYQGTDVRLGTATYDTYNASLTHYHRISDRIAFSAGGFYESEGGYFDNVTLGKKADASSSAGGRIRAIYLPTDNLKLDLNMNYEYSDEGAYPYYYKGALIPAAEAFKDDIGTIFNNRESDYYRNLFNTGLNLEYTGKNFVMSSVTGFQHLKDRMYMDQDFTSKDYFTVEQRQKQQTLSEELTFKSRGNDRRWDWVTGAFGHYQWQQTTAPVTFREDGMQEMLLPPINAQMAAGPMRLGFTENTMTIPGVFKTPSMSAALFHQSTLNNLIFEGLSATIGFRIDYEKFKIDYNTSANLGYQVYVRASGTPAGAPSTVAPEISGKADNEDTHLLPKFALKYDFNKRNNIYVSASRGYRSGGYNFQNISDLVNLKLREDLMLKLRNLPLSPKATEQEIEDYVIYKPEYTLSYELGSHLTLWNGKLQMDLAAFYMDTQDQQVSRFVDSGLGRATVNAGKSRSIGAEASVRTNLTDAFSMNLNYGYTYATFTDYTTNKKSGTELVDVSYNGNYVPFVPKHTFSLGGQYIFRMAAGSALDEVQLNADYTGAGRIYWTETNTASQPFYGTLNARIALVKGPGQIAFWVRNALDKKYDAFYFESMGRGIAQQGRPMQIGVDIRCRF